MSGTREVMKRGESDNVARQSGLGTIRTDADGRRWRKVRALTRDDWESALLNATFSARLRRVSDDEVRAMGYELETT